LKAKGAPKQEAGFEQLCARCTLLPLDDRAVTTAAGVHAALTRSGQPIGDADILIAATALVNGLGLVTNNRRHFERIPELTLENWLE